MLRAIQALVLLARLSGLKTGSTTGRSKQQTLHKSLPLPRLGMRNIRYEGRYESTSMFVKYIGLNNTPDPVQIPCSERKIP